MTTATILEIGMATDVIAEPHFVKRERLDSILYLYCFFTFKVPLWLARLLSSKDINVQILCRTLFMNNF